MWHVVCPRPSLPRRVAASHPPSGGNGFEDTRKAIRGALEVAHDDHRDISQRLDVDEDTIEELLVER
eukprot:5676652-Heterocapsa_arctica.AAC.1